MKGESRTSHSSEGRETKQGGNRGPAVRLVNVLLSRAVHLGASDIHIEPREESLVIRLRVDGVLQPSMTLDRKIRDSLVSRVKILANLDISERRLPQDGRLRIRVPQSNGSRVIDVRVTTLPTACGEKLVMRILDPACSRPEFRFWTLCSRSAGAITIQLSSVLSEGSAAILKRARACHRLWRHTRVSLTGSSSTWSRQVRPVESWIGHSISLPVCWQAEFGSEE